MESFSNLEAVPLQILATCYRSRKSFAVDGIQIMLLRLLMRSWPIWCFKIFFARRTLFWMKLGTFQFVFLRPVLMFLSVVLWTNGNYTPYNVSKYFKQRWSTRCIGSRADVSILVYNWTVKSGSTFKCVLTVLRPWRIWFLPSPRLSISWLLLERNRTSGWAGHQIMLQYVSQLVWWEQQDCKLPCGIYLPCVFLRNSLKKQVYVQACKQED